MGPSLDSGSKKMTKEDFAPEGRPKNFSEGEGKEAVSGDNSSEEDEVRTTDNPEASEKTAYSEKTDVEAPDADVDRKPPAIKVTRSQRRGLFGRLSVIAEVEEPKNYSSTIKWLITAVVGCAAIAAPLGSTIIFPALGQIAHDLNTTPTIANFSSAFYMLSMAIFPLWWSSFSETLGRRTIYLVSFTLFLVFNILAAVSVNISMLIVMRILGGGAAASVQAVGAGTIADVWEVRVRGKAMSIFYLGPLVGPLIGPIIGGVLADSLGWRSCLWGLVIYGGIVLLLIFFTLPETLIATKASNTTPMPSDATLSRTTSRSSAAALATKKYARSLHRFFIEPLYIILYLRYPAVLITIYYASITFGCLYLLNISLQATFSAPPYNFSTILVGLSYIPNAIGYILAALFGGKWIDRIMAREARRAGRYTPDGKLAYRPEDRMRENAWAAAILYPGALIWYGWTAEKGVFWLVPLIANFFFGVGSMLVFAVSTTMLTEFMPKRASAGVACNNFVRNICSFTGAIVGQPLINAIGNGWLFTIVGLWALASCVVVWAMRRFGPRWRDRMVRELG